MRSRLLARIAAGATVLLFAWAIASPVGRLDAPSSPRHATNAATIEAVAALAVSASDRPAGPLEGKRNQRSHELPAAVAIEAGIRSTFSGVARDVLFPLPLLSASPLEVGLVRRAPPPAVAR